MNALLRGLRLGSPSRIRRHDDLVSLCKVLDALGDDGLMGQWRGEVPVAEIVGTESETRALDFAADFRLRNRALDERWHRVACAVLSGSPLPPVDLVLVGEMYFVRDGHHRVSVARALGHGVIRARVQQICTVAFAMACLRAAHLASKAAERRFLDRVPLPVGLRCSLWLDDPAHWTRLADAAEAWGFRQSLQKRPLTDRESLAEAWWNEEVRPAVDALRADGAPEWARDVQVYVAALTTQTPAAPDGAAYLVTGQT
ncbi:MAG: hypothetical protein ACRDO0_15040 [Nocardioidaceae bacterium]